MKKIFLILMGYFSLSTGLKAQTDTEIPMDNWFGTFTMGFSMGGPNTSIENSMNNQDFNGTESGWFGPITFPITTSNPSFLFMLGKRITQYGSLYMVIGKPTAGTAHGYNGTSEISFDYGVTQFTLGYQFSFPKTHFKLGVGPSLFVFKNNRAADYQNLTAESSYIPGATLNIRIPLGKEKKLFGMELFGQVNMAPSAKMGEVPNQGRSFEASTVSMTYALIGITFAFRG